MKTLISITRSLGIAVAMFTFASGAWAEHDGDGIVHDDEVVTDSEVVGEDVVGEEVVGEEAQSGVAGEGEEVMIYLMDGDGSEVGTDATQYVDAEGNVVSVGGDGSEVTMYTPLMMASGVADGAVTLADTAADQAGIDSATALGLDVVGSTQADFASPIDVATVAADGSTRVGSGGTATRISGGHLDSHQ